MGDFVPFPLTVCNVYAAFDDPLDRLLGIENADLPVYDGKTPHVFFQHPANVAPHSPACNQISDPPPFGFPDLICDSFITIGFECGLLDPADETDLGDDGDTEEPLPLDLDGNPRFIDDLQSPDSGAGDCAITDKRAYELQAGTTLCCPADLDGDGTVGTADLEELLGNWGPNPDHAADFDDNGEVGAFDLALLLGAWGICE